MHKATPYIIGILGIMVALGGLIIALLPDGKVLPGILFIVLGLFQSGTTFWKHRRQKSLERANDKNLGSD
ncbi:hypothetical protein [Arthrobacter sp. Leaf337]|jgi:hypothetical protein|uniref:hypothetical protein n=1 Tax=Arthrobacter sp. Leaf337 TaxID=1736342 RepID=UPI000A982316|nr:hypothetical protein [Arthrobacter sp. Leaf337]